MGLRSFVAGGKLLQVSPFKLLLLESELNIPMFPELVK
jgi:hypothetical protein